MTYTDTYVKRTYYLLTLLSTLAASFIWGINTLFLLDAGLSNAAAFAANAFFTVGQVIFEVPTGLVADTRGRKVSYALGAATLLVTTVAYYALWQSHGPFWAWAIVSALLGLGFTFFSGATEAWLVDALHFTGYKGPLESVFARGQSIGGAAMLIGSVSGGMIAQATNLGVPYLVRAGVLVLTFLACIILMRDLGFSPAKGKSVVTQIKDTLSTSLENGWRVRPVRYMMLGAPFAGILIYVFYAMQPFLLQLYGNPKAYGIAGLAAAIVAGAQIIGGMSVNFVRRFFRTRTAVIIIALVGSTVLVAAIGLTHNFWLAIILLAFWGLIFALVTPVRQAYLNGLIASEHRATVLSFDNLLNSGGGAITQPILGRVADAHGYGASFLVSAAIGAGALPFLWLARKQHASSDPIDQAEK
jgi:MFS family permease